MFCWFWFIYIGIYLISILFRQSLILNGNMHDTMQVVDPKG